MIAQFAKELAHLPAEKRRSESAIKIAGYLDRSSGRCWLSDPRIAQTVENAILYFDAQRYSLIAWCIMPNHVHAMLETKEGFPLYSVLQSWKSFTAKASNKILNRTGEFWDRDYHDRYIRNGQHFENAKNYIEWNPVKAGLVRNPEDWRWSSARKARYDLDSSARPSRLEAGAPM